MACFQTTNCDDGNFDMLAALLLVLLTAGASGESIQIGVKKRPDVCTVKSEVGDTLTIHYTVCAESLIMSSRDQAKVHGEKQPFFNTMDDSKPFEFKLGKGRVMKGLDRGLTKSATFPSSPPHQQDVCRRAT
jgi:hypothetical protein